MKILNTLLCAALLLACSKSAVTPPATVQPPPPVVVPPGPVISFAAIPTDSLLNLTGYWHNEYQDTMLTLMLTQDVSDTVKLKQWLSVRTRDFFTRRFKTIGLKYTDAFSITFHQPNAARLTAAKYSEAGGHIMDDFSATVTQHNQSLQYGFTDNIKFFAKLNDLKAAALTLPRDEALSIGIPISVAIASYTYWNANADKWRLKFTDKSIKCKVGLGQLGAADVSGAIAGGFDGVVLGPGGALAGAVLGSATSSLGNVAGQVMGCLFKWW